MTVCYERECVRECVCVGERVSISASLSATVMLFFFFFFPYIILADQ